MKILFLTNVPSPYRVRFFNALAQLCDLTVVYEKGKSDERDARWTEKHGGGYRSVILQGLRTSTDSAISPGILKFLKKDAYNLVIVCGIASPTQMLAIQWCRLRGIPYAIEGDGAFPKSGKGPREWLKRHLIRGACLCFSTCEMHDAYYLLYGAGKETLVRYPFTSVDEREVLPAPVSPEEKARLREELGIREEKLLLAVGQFIPRKGFDVLLQAARKLPEDVGICIVGGEPTEEYLQMQKKWDLDRVRFAGFMPREKLASYYRAADAFVLPTREDIWGLVVNEAMAYGLPVVTTTRCNAGLELIREGENGRLVAPEDADALAEALLWILENDREKMAARSLAIIRDFTIEQMARRHGEIFAQYLEDKIN